MRLTWLWPAIILVSALAVCLSVFVFSSTIIRPFIAMEFLFICPGMAFVRLLRLRETVVEWSLAIALSFAIDGIVAGLMLYAGKWSPPAILGIIVCLSVGGAFAQLATSNYERIRSIT